MIVSFTLFRYDLKYYVGAQQNIEQVNSMLPGWKTRIYYHEDLIIKEEIEKLKMLDAEFINVKGMEFGGKDVLNFPYFWRFFSFLNDERSIVRDLDSRLSKREVQYINNWIESDKDYFIIRDHPWHSKVPSGLFGIKRAIQEFKQHFEDYIANKEEIIWGDDQDILEKYSPNMKQEDVFYCGYDDKTNFIPRDDQDFFIGLQLDQNNQPIEPNGTHSIRYLKELGL